MDLVDHQGIGGKYVSVLEPSSRDPRRDHDHVPGRRLGRRFALAIHYPGFQNVGAEDRLGDRADGECFTGARAGHDPESLPRCRQLANFLAVLLLEDRRDPQAECELDCLAGSARGGDDDEATCRRLSRYVRLAVRREVSVGDGALHSPWKLHTSHRMRNGPGRPKSHGAVAMTKRLSDCGCRCYCGCRSYPVASVAFCLPSAACPAPSATACRSGWRRGYSGS